VCRQFLQNTHKKENRVNNNQIGRLGNGMAARQLAHGVLITLIVLGIAGIAIAQTNTDNDTALKFKGGIGVIPVTGVAANGAATLNIVRGVSPGGPWRIANLEAEVGFNGHIKVVGRGLLLASGNGIGTNAGQSVHATLFCGAAAAATAHNSTPTGVALAADGDFTIDDFLSPPPPASCDTPVLLIRNVVGVWFAAGIPRVAEDGK
jgi:hypothetical protein